MYTVEETDIIVSSDAFTSVRDQVDYNRQNHQNIEVYGKGLALDQVPHGMSYIDSPAKATAYAQWIAKLGSHTQHIVDNPALFLPYVRGEQTSVVIKSNGITTKWSQDNIGQWLKVKQDVITKMLDGIATTTDDVESSSRIYYTFNDDRLSEEYIGQADKPMLQRAMWYAKRRKLQNLMLGVTGIELDYQRDSDKRQLFIVVRNGTSGFTVQQAVATRSIVEVYQNMKVRPDELSAYRRHVLEIQTSQLRRDDTIRRQLASKQFTVYWDNMKARQRAVAPSEEQAAEQFATIPLAEAGTPSSRTWGIEVETVRADQTRRPAGWQDVYDGSLPEGGCECSCDSCYDGDHCDDRDYCSNGTESREFVSPVLNSYNSDGLRRLCTDLGDHEESTAPGIHVHVGAGDLTVTDVARLLFAYGAIAPLLKPLYHRAEFGYCHEMQGNNVQWWLSAVKSWLRTDGSIPNPRNICEQQPASRYQDVNLHSLAKHGTIEFRSMGPFYNYDHLVRWAWLVREMVNVSKLGLDQRLWTACKSLTDVIELLRKYGSEMPLDKELTNIITNDLVLSSDEQ